MTPTPNPQHPAYQLLARAHSPSTASTLFVDKVLHKPLILRPTSPDPASHDARSARRLKRLRANERAAQKQKPKRLSAKEKRQLGIYEIPRKDQRYELFVPLHRLWLGYMREILGLNRPQRTQATQEPKGEGGSQAVATQQQRALTPNGAGPFLVSADYHGALLQVVRCRCPDRVGIEGIVVRDTKFTFELVTRENVIKVIPKEHTIFRFEVSGPAATEATEPSEHHREAEKDQPVYAFELSGSHLQHRAVDRANKKFKPRKVED